MEFEECVKMAGFCSAGYKLQSLMPLHTMVNYQRVLPINLVAKLHLQQVA